MDHLLTRAARGELRLVLPSEIAADWWRRESVRRRSKPIWERQIVSWDRFKELAFDIHADARPANNAIRTCFAESLLRENASERFLDRLVPPAGAQHSGFRPLLVQALPGALRFSQLPRALLDRLDPTLIRDVEAVAERYRRFLSERDLYEPGELARGSQLREDEQWHLLHGELTDDFDEFASRLVSIGNHQFTPAPMPRVCRFTTFGEELRSTIAQIAELIDRGVEPEAIVITVGRLDLVRDRVEQAAELYEVPLSLRAGVSLAESVPGRFLAAIGAVADSFAIDAVKALLLTPGVPWVDYKANRAVVARAIRSGALVDREVFRSAAPPDTDSRSSREYAGKVARAARAVAQARSFSLLQQALSRFLSSFVDGERWHPEAALILQRCREELNRLIELERELSISVGNPFSFWLERLQRTPYARRHRGEGIAVYPYRVSALIRPQYHFVLGATAAATSVRVSAFPWLTDPERSVSPQSLGERDLTQAIFSAYAGSGERVTFSYSERAIDGAALPASWLVSSGALLCAEEGAGPADDRYTAERAADPGMSLDSVYPIQLHGAAAFAATYPTAAPTLFSEPLSDSYAARAIEHARADTQRPDKLRLSATDLAAFAACPFSFAIAAVGVADDLFEIEPDSPAEIGQLYHRSLERYYQELQDAGLTLGAESAGAALHRLRACAEAEFSGRAPGMLARGTVAAYRRVFDRIAAWIVQTDRDHFSDHRPELVEEWRSATGQTSGGGVVLFGRIDRLTRAPDGSVSVIDHKKGKLPRHADVTAGSEKPVGAETDHASQLATLTEPQLPFYALLLMHEGEQVGSLGFYGLERGSYEEVAGEGSRAWMDRDRLAQVVALTEELVFEIAARVAAGDYTAGEGPFACEQCAFRAVCRTRFVVR